MDRIMKAGFGLALGLTVSLGGCVVTPVDRGYLDDYETPSPYPVPLYGERYRNPDGVMVVYDSGSGAYVVEGRRDVYWRDHHYYRLQDGRWERSRRHFGPWEYRWVEQRPLYPRPLDGHSPRGRTIDPDPEQRPRQPRYPYALPIERPDTDWNHSRPRSRERGPPLWSDRGARPRPEPWFLAVGRSAPPSGTKQDARQDWQRQQNAEHDGLQTVHRDGPPVREENRRPDWPSGLAPLDQRKLPERRGRDREQDPGARSRPGLGQFRPQY